MDIERIVVRLLADASSYNRVMDGVDARLRDFARRSESMTAILAAPFALATQAVMSFSRALVESSVGAVEAAMNYEVLTAQFEVLAGSAEKGQKLFEDLLKTAVETPFKVKDVVSAAKEIKAFGFETEHVNDIVRQLGDISSATGTPMHRLILAFGQTRIAGRLMGQEMRQFVNANVPMIEHLAAVMGKPASQIKKMIENGQVGFDMVVKALNKMTGEGGVFAGMMDKISKTTQGRWNSFVESLEISLFKAGGAFMKGFRLDELLQDFRKWAEGLGQSGEGFENIGQRVRAAWDSVASSLKIAWTVIVQVTNVIRDAWNAVSDWVDRNQALIKGIVGILAVLSSFRILVFGVTTAVNALSAAIGILKSLLGINAIISAWSGLAAAVTSPLAPIFLFIGALAAVISLSEDLRSSFDGFGESIVDGFFKIGEAASQTWQGIKDAFKVGDLRLAFDIAWAGVKHGFMLMVASIQAEWHRFINTAFTKAGALGAAQTWLAKDIVAAEAWIRILNPFAGEAEVKKATKQYWENIQQLEEMRKVEKAAPLDPAIQKEIDRIMREVPASTKAELDRLTGMASRKVMLSDRPFLAVEEEVIAFTKDFKEGQAKLLANIKRMELALAWSAGELPHPVDRNVIQDWLDWSRFYKAKYEKELFSSIFMGFELREHLVDKMMRGEYAEARERYSKNVEGYSGRLRDALGPMMIEMMKIAPHLGVGLNALGAVVSSSKAFNVQPDHYDISGASKTYAQNLQQKYMRGVGEETHKFDYFTQHMKMIEEARTGLTDSMYQIAEGGGIFGSIAKSLGRQRRALSDEEAEYGMLEEFDKLRKYVGDRTTTGPRAMLQGSAEAQEVINRTNAQPTSVLENIRTILFTAKEMQAAQLEYQKEAAMALRSLVSLRPLPIAPMPREKDVFAVIDPPPM